VCVGCVDGNWQQVGCDDPAAVGCADCDWLNQPNYDYSCSGYGKEPRFVCDNRPCPQISGNGLWPMVRDDGLNCLRPPITDAENANPHLYLPFTYYWNECKQKTNIRLKTTTIVTSSANPSVYGQSVTFTATVSVDSPGTGTPTGLVTFRDRK